MELSPDSCFPNRRDASQYNIILKIKIRLVNLAPALSQINTVNVFMALLFFPIFLLYEEVQDD